jgi:hypothetical protein
MSVLPLLPALRLFSFLNDTLRSPAQVCQTLKQVPRWSLLSLSNCNVSWTTLTEWKMTAILVQPAILWFSLTRGTFVLCNYPYGIRVTASGPQFSTISYHTVPASFGFVCVWKLSDVVWHWTKAWFSTCRHRPIQQFSRIPGIWRKG